MIEKETKIERIVSKADVELQTEEVLLEEWHDLVLENDKVADKVKELYRSFI